MNRVASSYSIKYFSKGPWDSHAEIDLVNKEKALLALSGAGLRVYKLGEGAPESGEAIWKFEDLEKLRTFSDLKNPQFEPLERIVYSVIDCQSVEDMVDTLDTMTKLPYGSEDELNALKQALQS